MNEQDDAHKDAAESARDTKDSARSTQDAVDRAEAAHLDSLNDRQDAEQDTQDSKDAKDAKIAQALIEELERATQRKEFWLRMTLILMATFVVASIMTIGYAVANIRKSQQEGSPIQEQILALSKENHETAELLKDCTTPGGKCNTVAEQQRGDAVELINEATIYAIACANRYPSGNVKVIQRCVKDLYEENNGES